MTMPAAITGMVASKDGVNQRRCRRSLIGGEASEQLQRATEVAAAASHAGSLLATRSSSPNRSPERG
jgi:hypothetical protein